MVGKVLLQNKSMSPDSQAALGAGTCAPCREEDDGAGGEGERGSREEGKQELRSQGNKKLRKERVGLVHVNLS